MPDTEEMMKLADVEQMARAMAVADGFDPDAQASGGPNDFALRAKDFNGYAVGVYGPVWQTYQRRANLLLASLRARANGGGE